jgi:hypothetical protein
MAHLIDLYECGGAHFAAILETETGERVLACIAEPEGAEPWPDDLDFETETEDRKHD